MFWTISIFKKSKMFQKEMPKRPLYFIFKEVSRSCVGFSSVYQNCTKEEPSKWRQYFVHQNYVRHIETRSNFRLTKLHKNSSVWKFNVEITLASNQRQFYMLYSLGTQIFIVPPVAIRLVLFESQRPENRVKPALKSSKKLSINEPLTCGTG